MTSAALVAVQAILHADFGGRVSEMRAYWQKYKGMKLEDRWYAILADDTAGAGRWREAAANISQPESTTTFSGTGWRVERAAPTNAPVRLRGEPLRGKTNPSVSELLARRAVEVPASTPAPMTSGPGAALASAWRPGIRGRRCRWPEV